MLSTLPKSSKALPQKCSICNGQANWITPKNKQLRELKDNFRAYGYPEKVIKIWIQKALKIPQTDLRHPKTIENNNNLTFISTFNPNNRKIFDLVKSGVNTVVENNVNDFKNIKLIYTKRQPPNLKRI